MKYSVLITYLLLLPVPYLNAQVGSFRNIDNGDGLLDWRAHCFYKDSNGFIWIGGNIMVERFDGRHIKQYVFSEDISRVNALGESKNKIIYAATSNGLFKTDANKSSFSRIYPDVINNNVLSLYIDGFNKIYAGTEVGLTIISQNKTQQIQIENADFPFNKILAMYKADNEILWLLTPGGIASFNENSGSILTYPFKQWNSQTYFTCMTGIDSVLFIGSRRSGIYRFDTQTGKITFFMSVGNDAITSVTSDNNSQLYAGTAGTGVFIISVPEKRIIRSFDSSPQNYQKLTSSMVSTLMVDNLGILWVGNSEALGFDYMYIEPKAFNLYRTSSFTTQDLPVHGLFFGDGYKLLTNSYGIYYISEDDGIVHFFENGVGKTSFLKPGDVFSFITYGYKVILGGENGIYSLDPDKINLDIYRPMKFLKDKIVYHMNTDSKGNLWVGSNTGLHIYNWETEKVKTYNTLNSNIIDNIVRFVFFDSYGRTWICTEKGICLWDDVKKEFNTNGFPPNFINQHTVKFITEDRKGNLLFCYNIRNVLYAESNLGGFRRVCTEEDADFTGLGILKVLQDSTGAFWFIGSRGTIRANEALTEYALFTTTEGIMEPYATDGRFDKNGNLWLATNKGLFYSKGEISRTIAPMAITDIKVNGISRFYEMEGPVENGDRIFLDKYSNNLEFQFALLTYDRPDLLVYECKLIGYENDWQFLRGLNALAYKDLEPGEYTFLVRRSMDHTCFREVYFEIKPYFLFKGEIAITFIILFMIIVGAFILLIDRKKLIVNKRLKLAAKREKYQFNKISEDEANIIVQKLKKCMDEGKPYLKENLKMTDLAKEIGCSNQTLSQVFNVFMKQKYYDYINSYRIEEFKFIILTKEYSKYTLKELARKSGFSSYTSFYRAFKEQTGITPHEFIQKQKN